MERTGIVCISLAALFALAFAAPPAVDSTKACKQGDSWKEDCHTCFCGNGGLKFCTREICVENPDPTQTIETKTGCNKEGATWKDDCNTCTCMKGLEACTKILCNGPQVVLPAEKTKRSTDSLTIDANQACVEGSSWKEDCHTCSCQKGRRACTRELCESEQTHKLVLPDPTHINFEKACQPNDVWKEGCNTCHCSNDGKPACTRKLCPPKESLTDEERKQVYN